MAVQDGPQKGKIKIFNKIEIFKGFREGLGRVLGRFCEGFGRVLGGIWGGFRTFWKDFERSRGILGERREHRRRGERSEPRIACFPKLSLGLPRFPMLFLV